MRYYVQRPVLVYVLLSTLGTLLAGFILSIYEAAVGDVTYSVRLSILILSFCSYSLFFIVRAIYKRDHRDYVELLKGEIRWVSYNKWIESTDMVSASDVLLIEIEYETGAELPSYYNVFVRGRVRFKQLEIFPISLEDIIQYCKENKVATLVTHMQFRDVDEVKISSSSIKIKYYPKTALKWGKVVNIPFSEIAGITRVIMHPVSLSQNHYVISTRSGSEYKFNHYEIDPILIETYAQAHGMQVVEINVVH